MLILDILVNTYAVMLAAQVSSILTPPLHWPDSLITEQTRLPSSHEAEPNEHIIVFTLR